MKPRENVLSNILMIDRKGRLVLNQHGLNLTFINIVYGIYDDIFMLRTLKKQR